MSVGASGMVRECEPCAGVEAQKGLASCFARGRMLSLSSTQPTRWSLCVPGPPAWHRGPLTGAPSPPAPRACHSPSCLHLPPASGASSSRPPLPPSPKPTPQAWSLPAPTPCPAQNGVSDNWKLCWSEGCFNAGSNYATQSPPAGKVAAKAVVSVSSGSCGALPAIDGLGGDAFLAALAAKLNFLKDEVDNAPCAGQETDPMETLVRGAPQRRPSLARVPIAPRAHRPRAAWPRWGGADGCVRPAGDVCSARWPLNSAQRALRPTRQPPTRPLRCTPRPATAPAGAAARACGCGGEPQARVQLPEAAGPPERGQRGAERRGCQRLRGPRVARAPAGAAQGGAGWGRDGASGDEM